MTPAVPMSTYRMYAKKYKIPLTKNKKYKSWEELSNDIFEYEKENRPGGFYY